MTNYDLRRQKQREATENRIIESAIKLFGAKGYAKTSIKDIAEEAEVANGLVGKYYATKEVLLSEAYKHATLYSYPYSENKNNANEAVKKLIRQTVWINKEKPEYYRFFKTMMNASDLPQEYIDARRNFFCKSTIYPHIINEQEKGHIPKGNQHDYFILLMKIIFDFVEFYNQMPHDSDNNVAGKTIELVMNTIEECLNNDQ